MIRCEDDTPELLLDTELLLDNHDVPVIIVDNEQTGFSGGKHEFDEIDSDGSSSDY